ncbi:MAG: hypothetical protein K6E90_08815 [Lachnospiraceae bacterium]|nr:hypothetical protein [Lachnospiraceae bacterium]
MGSTKQKEQQLRQVNINTTVSAVSESLNTLSSGLVQIEDTAPGLQITSPVMKQVNALPVTIPSGVPSEDEVIEAHQEVGLKLSANSKKHPRRVKRAAEKRDLQRTFNSTRESVDQKIADLAAKEDTRMAAMNEEDRKQYILDKQADTFDSVNKLDLSVLMCDKTKGTTYEKLTKNYNTIKPVLSKIPEYARELEKRLSDTNLTPEKKMELVKCRARLATLLDIRAYYEVYERLITNKYYAMLPHEEMHGLSYKELRFRLSRLYSDTGKDHRELIDYYQNLIRLKELGLSDGASVKERESGYFADMAERAPLTDHRDPKEELKKMATAYERMQKYLAVQGAFLPEKKKNKYLAQMFGAFADDIEKFRTSYAPSSGSVHDLLVAYDESVAHPLETEDKIQDTLLQNKPEDESMLEKSNAPLRGVKLTADQLEGVKRIGSWILRHSLSSARQYPAFASNLLETTPEQQLLVFYLLENEKYESASAIDFFTALHNYVPDPANFKDKMKLDRLSRALRTSMTIYPELKRYAEISADLKDSDDAVLADQNKTAPVQRPLEDQRTALVEAISKRGVLLKMLYRNAGLHEDMPPDMAEDPVLRKKLFDEYTKLGSMISQLDSVNKKINDNKPQSVAYTSDKLRDDSEENQAEEESSTLEKTDTVVNTAINEYLVGYGVNTLGNVIDSVGGYASAMTETVAFGQTTGWLGGLTSILGLAGAVVTSAAIATDHTLSVADRTAQAISVTSDFLGATGDTVTAVGTLVNAFTVAPEASSELSWLGSSSDALWASTAVGDKIAMAGGAIGALAGAVKTTAETVQLGRAISSRHDVKRSRKTLAEKDQSTLTQDEKLLKRFLAHEDREITRKEVSSGVGMVVGAMAMASGVMLMTGFLTPIAGALGLASLVIDVGFGKFLNANRRHAHRRQTVDDMLGIDSLVEKTLADHPQKEQLKKMSKSDLKDRVRTEALAMMGFSSYHECFRHICTEYATMLYNKVFVDVPADEKEKAMYLDAMKSLGMKIKHPRVQGDPGKPSIDAMITKMMG